MRKICRKLAAAGILAGVLAAGLSSVPALADTTAAAPIATAATPGKIVVNGSGSVTVKPDMAQITLGVQTTNADAKTAQSQNAAQMNALLTSLKKNGVADDDIQTTGYYMYPMYDDNQAITGYQVSNAVTVTVRDLTKIGDLIDAAVAVGGNSIQNVSFNIADPSAYYAQALTAAITNAQAKAGVVAAALDVTIGKPVEVDEQGSYYPAPIYGNASMAAVNNGAAQSGTIQITASVTATYNY